MTNKPMRIVSLKANDVLRLQAVEIAPDGNIITLGGNNAQGKSSVMDSIMMALGGKRYTPTEPIRRGAKKASITLNIGEYVVERNITAKSDSLKVTSPDGASQFKSPQTLLDGLFTTIAFDPIAFSRIDPKRQAEQLRDLVGLDFGDLDAKRRDVFDARTIVNRDGKALSARVEAAPHHDDAPETEVSVVALSDKLDEMRVRIDKNEQARRNADAVRSVALEAARAVSACEANIKELKTQLQDSLDELGDRRLEESNAKDAAVGAAEKADALTDPDPEPVRQQIRDAEATNRKARENATRAALLVELEQQREKSRKLSDQLKAIDDDKAGKLAAAEFPVDGLGFDDDGVTYQELPFAQASTAEKLRVSVAIGIAQNPKLRVLLVRDGATLDANGLKLLAEMAAEHDCQIWLEDNRTTDPAAVMIEDGRIAGEPGKEG